VQSLGNAPGLNNSSASAHASSNVSEASASVMAEDALPESGRKPVSMAIVQPGLGLVGLGSQLTSDV
jgi:hypothetical protein